MSRARASRGGGPGPGAGWRATRALWRLTGACTHSRILEASWESSDSPRSGRGALQSRLPPQVKVAMVISGEFLVSVRSGPTAAPLVLGRGLGGPPAVGAAGRGEAEGARATEGRGQVQPGFGTPAQAQGRAELARSRGVQA